jgi:hypothetical protein
MAGGIYTVMDPAISEEINLPKAYLVGIIGLFRLFKIAEVLEWKLPCELCDFRELIFRGSSLFAISQVIFVSLVAN